MTNDITITPIIEWPLPTAYIKAFFRHCLKADSEKQIQATLRVVVGSEGKNLAHVAVASVVGLDITHALVRL